METLEIRIQTFVTLMNCCLVTLHHLRLKLLWGKNFILRQVDKLENSSDHLQHQLLFKMTVLMEDANLVL
jgi:hypothetical protein